jgi:hypothetical protein
VRAAVIHALCALVPVALCLLVLAAAPRAAVAAAPLVGGWTPEGTPVCTVAGNQLGLVGVSDGTGGALFAWEDHRAPQSGIYAVRVTAGGTAAAGWSIGGSPIASAGGNQIAPSIASDGSGGAFVAWQDDRDGHAQIYIQHVTADGSPSPGWPVSGLALAPDSTSDQEGQLVVLDGGGGAVVAWDDYTRTGGGPTAIMALKITGTGQPAPGWPPGGVTVVAAVYQFDYYVLPRGGLFEVPDLRGGALVAWNVNWYLCSTHCDSGHYFAVRHVLSTPAGPVIGPDERVASTIETAGSGLGPRPSGVSNYRGGQDVVSAGGDGRGGMMTWYYDDSDVLPGTFAARYDTTGERWRLRLWTDYLGPGAFAPDVSGGDLIVWSDGDNVVGLHVTSSGSPAPGWAVTGNLLAAAPAQQFGPAAASDGGGGAFVTWFDARSGNTDIYATHVEANGAISPGWTDNGNPVCDVPGNKIAQVLIDDPTGATIVAWEDLRTSTNWDIYAQRLTIGSPVPAALSLVRAGAMPGVAQLEWFAPAGTVPRAIVYRREPSTPWTALASLAQDGNGHLVLSDSSVASGRRYGYRLGTGPDGAISFTDEVWLDIPGRMALAIRGFRPNPARGDAAVVFTLPSSDPARLELFGLDGRRITSCRLDSPSIGAQVFDLGAVVHLQPGMYWLRLSQSGHSVMGRGFLLR